MYVAEDLTLKPIYGAVISNFYNTSLEKLDFGKPADAAEHINNFVREKTNGIIPTIFDESSLDKLSRFVNSALQFMLRLKPGSGKSCYG